MKIVVIRRHGLIGSKLVKKLQEKGQRGHRGRARYRRRERRGAGEGLEEALCGAQVVVDLANAPVWEDKAVLELFETSGRNLMAAEKAAGVKHHLALSIVGSDRSPDSGYLRAKVAQEDLIEAARHSLYDPALDAVASNRSEAWIESGGEGNVVRLSPALVQPTASDGVVANLAELTLRTAAERHRRGCRPGSLSDGQVRARVPGRQRRQAQSDRRRAGNWRCSRARS